MRHLALNDTQIGPKGELLTEIDTQFCSKSGTVSDNNGYCVGDTDEKTGKSKGKWFFAVSGQIYPKIKVTSRGGRTVVSQQSVGERHL